VTPRSPLVRRPGAFAQGRDVFGVGASQLPDAQRQDERDRSVQVARISVLDEFFELIAQGCGELDGRGASCGRTAHELAHGDRAIRESMVGSELLEERLFLGGQAHAEKIGRWSVGSSGPHGV